MDTSAPVAKKPPIPAAKPAKSRFKKPRSLDNEESELQRKMKERRERFTKSSSVQKPEPESSLETESSAKQETKPDSGKGSNSNDVQMQLQFLQQQVIQQQMMQLQQQFQQLLVMNPGMNVPGMGMMGMNMSGGMGVNPGPMGMNSAGGMGMNHMTGMGSIPAPGSVMPNPMVNAQTMGMPGMGNSGMGNPNVAFSNVGMNTGTMGMTQGSNGAMGMPIPGQPGTGMNYQGMQTQTQNTFIPAQNQFTNSPQVPVPQGISPIHPMMSPNTVHPSTHQQVMLASQGHVTPTLNTPPISNTPPLISRQHEVPAPPEAEVGETPPSNEVVAAQPEKKPTDSERKRSQAMGVAEDKFDMLMDDIRDTNAHNLLRRVSFREKLTVENSLVFNWW